MAPEQLQGRAMPATDIYAVGATALAALAGREPDTLPHRGLRLDVRASLAEAGVSEGMVTALESMLEPDPTLRAQEVGAALESLPSLAPPPLAPTPGAMSTAEEDATVKSVRKLVWVLWGLSWLGMPLAGRLVAEEAMIAFQFATLGLVLVLTWHKGFLLRRALRRFLGAPAPVATPVRVRVDAPPVQARVQIASGSFPQGAEHQATEVEPSAPAARRMSR